MYKITIVQIMSGMILLFLIVLSIKDIRYRKISVRALLLLGGMVVVYRMGIFCAGFLQEISWSESSRELLFVMLGGMVGTIFLSVSKVTKEQIGYGDSWLILLLGLYLGIRLLIEVLTVALMILGIAGMICYRKKRSLPFVPFLTIGYLVVGMTEFSFF